jgi:hypothetical protein
MTKSRDLANAATALNAVTATELGFVDGVTSAIQTQLDAKLASSTAATTYVANSLADAKGDLLTATADNTPARLAVGSNGDTLVADSSTSTGLRYSPAPALGNPVLNSAFQIWQRGTSITNGTVVYAADRWQAYGSGNATLSRQSTGDSTNLPNIQYCARYQRTNGSTDANYMYLAQNFETINSIPYAGKTVTMSFYARKGANYSQANSGLNVGLATGTGVDEKFNGYTNTSYPINTTVTLTSTWQRFTLTGTIASNVTEIAPVFVELASGTAGAADYFEITGVQIDIGSVALPFRTYAATLQGELAACQRYYWRSTAESSYSRFTEFNTANSATTMFPVLRNPVRMRVKPSSIEYSTLQGYDGSSLLGAVSALTLGGDATNDWTVLTATLSGMTQYRPTQLIANNSTSAYLGFSAEL